MAVPASLLSVSGPIDRELVPDPARWVRERETFIRTQSTRFAHLQPAVPVRYRLDENFVAAARIRRSMEVVDDCEGALCGVATDELRREWDVADMRALFTPPEAPRHERDAFAAALLGTFEGESVDAWAADIVRAGVTASSDSRVIVPLLASRIRFVDPRQRATFARSRELVAAIDEAQWRAHLLGVAPARSPAKRPVKLPMRGATFSVVNRLEGHILAHGSRAELARLRRLGFDTIALIPYGGQRGFAGVEIRRFDSSPHGETDLSMRLGAARVRALGMRLMMKPHVWTSGEGVGDPTRIEPADWERWFASYESFAIHHALLARALGAEWLSIGTELSRTEGRAEWRRIIGIVRALFPGKITYAANFDAVERTPFWDAVDAIGVDAYYPLSPNPNATDRELRAGAAAVVARLERLSRTHEKPVIVTELGYASTKAPWIEPWRERRDLPAETADQARAFKALLRAVSRSQAVVGWFIWKYESDPSRSDPHGFLPKDKPAEQTLRKYLK